MKRFFVLFSNLFITSFLLWIAFLSPNTVIHDSLPSVVVFEQKRNVTYDEVSTSMNSLAQDTNSLIGRQIEVTDESGQSQYSHGIYGVKEVPNGIIRADKELAAKESLVTNYYILSGNLKLARLEQELQALGFSKTVQDPPNPLQNFIAFFGSGAQSLALVIFILSFVALSIIQKTLEMRSAGIRYIAGMRLSQLFSHSLLEDFKELLMGGIITSLIGFLLIICLHLTPFAYSLILYGSFIYNGFLLLLSILLSFLFAFSIKTVHLVSLLKGKVPLKRIIMVLFSCQFLAVALIGLAIHRVSIYGSIWQIHQEGRRAWSQETNWVSIGTSREDVSQVQNQDTREENWSKWPKLIESGIKNGGLLVEHNSTSFNSKGLTTDPRTGKQLSIMDYDPLANTLYVTPNYLDLQKVPVSTEVRERLNHLQIGEFGLLLPEKLKGQETDLQKRYEAYLSILEEGSEKVQLAMKAQISYLPNHQRRFIYNNTPLSYVQFLTDPILVILKPNSFGTYQNTYFSVPNPYLYFDGLEKSKQLVAENGLEKNVSQYDYAANVYYHLAHQIQLENLMTIAGGILGMATSILLFNTMTFLYFEEFRRPIFLKTIAGLSFLQVHRGMLTAELSLLLIGSLLTYFLTQEWWIALGTMALFTLNAWIILLYRSHKEEQLLATVLKGA